MLRDRQEGSDARFSWQGGETEVPVQWEGRQADSKKWEPPS